MPRTAFYAWQSDLPNATNRTFIRRALDAALTAVNADLEAYDPIRADQDTQDVAGSPSVAEVIFSKIDECAVFVADITTVTGRVAARPMPNPNVLIEYGRASKKGDAFLVQVFNEAFGDWEERPFDLRHKRKPITYNLAEDHTPDQRKAELLRLSRDFAAAIRATLAATLARPPLVLPERKVFDHLRADYTALTISEPEWRGRRLPGFWCGAIPVVPLDIGRVSDKPELLVARKVLATNLTLNCETIDLIEEKGQLQPQPMQNGLRTTNQRRFFHFHEKKTEWSVGQIAVRRDGSVFIGGKTSEFTRGAYLNVRWIMADIANALRAIEAIRVSIGRGVAYALMVELRYDEHADSGLRPVQAGEWRLCNFEDETGTLGPQVTSQPITLGPYEVGPVSSYVATLRTIFADVYEATGRSAPPDVTFII